MKPMSRGMMKQRLIEAASTDERIVGLVDYGSGSLGRDDEWSDIDVALFLHDADFETFRRTWEQWAAQLGDLLFTNRVGVGQPWIACAAQPMPLLVDFNFLRESEIKQILNWPISPQSVEAMVWYDGSGGQIARCVQQMIGQSTRPADLPATFEQVSGRFWYYVLYTFSKWKRGQRWLVWLAFHFQLMQSLFALLRLEAGALDGWQNAPVAWNVEHTLSPERLAHLEACIPAPDLVPLKRSLVAAAKLGYDACEQIALHHGWEWPRELAEQTLQVISE